MKDNQIAGSDGSNNNDALIEYGCQDSHFIDIDERDTEPGTMCESTRRYLEKKYGRRPATPPAPPQSDPK
jgi:hypothetical protein